MAATYLTRRNALRLALGATAGVAITGNLPSLAIAQDTATRFVGTDLLNVREEPSLAATILETLVMGEEVEIDASQRKAADGVNWIYVTVVASGTQGWVDFGYLTEGLETPEAEGTPEAPAEETIGAAATATGTRWVSVADANLRSGAGLTFDVITTLPIGQEVEITGEGTAADGYTWYPVTVSTVNGWLADIVFTDVPPANPDFAQGTAVTVTTDVLNLRDEAGIASEILGTYPYGTAATIVSPTPIAADDIVWHQVEIDEDGAIGWFAEEYIGASGTGGATSSTVQISDGPVNLRSAPGLAGEVLDTVPSGVQATLILPDFTAADGFQWISVKLADQSGREGWIASEFVTFL